MSPMADQDREEYIVYCGFLMQEAYAAGNRQEAEQWMQAQNHAIRSRSAAQVANMEEELGLPKCETFVDMAELDLPAILRKQAA